MRRAWLALLLLALLAGTAVAQDAPGRAGLVVVLDDQRVEMRCVTFDQPSISGYALLERSGLAFESQSGNVGTLMCSIASVGCPAEDCFCQCQGGGEECRYWSYWQQGEDGWDYAVAGAAVSQVRDGDVQGWVWGVGASGSASEPPAVSLDEICAEPAAAVVDEPAPSPVNWWPYAAFGLLALAMAFGLLAINRRGGR